MLQAGTAVLVDTYGKPVVRCRCGNPLLPPVEVSSPVYTGPRWPGFSPTTIIVIEVSPTPIFPPGGSATTTTTTRPGGSAEDIDLSGTWARAGDTDVTITRVGDGTYSGTYRGQASHSAAVATFTGTFDGTVFSGTFHIDELDVTGDGTFSFSASFPPGAPTTLTGGVEWLNTLGNQIEVGWTMTCQSGPCLTRP